MAPNSKTVGTKTPKINPNLPFVVIHLMLKFHRFLFTYTKVIVRKSRKMLIWALFWPLIPKLLGPKPPKTIIDFYLLLLKLECENQTKWLHTTTTTTPTSYQYTTKFLRSYKNSKNCIFYFLNFIHDVIFFIITYFGKILNF